MEKLAIVGSRNYNNFEEFSKTIDKYLPISEIISGGCRGTDLMAKRYAMQNKINYKEFPADWKRYGKAAGPIRNKLIVDASDAVIAFLSPSSKGTLNSINYAKKQKKKLIVVKLHI